MPPDPSSVFRVFNPHDQLKLQTEARHPRWLELSEGIGLKSLDELRGLNAYWFREAMAFDLTAPMLWQINREITRRGVAPMWRGVPRFVQDAIAPPPNPMSKGPRSLGEVARKNLMKRWIDMEWLRTVLGPSHVTKHKSWQIAFDSDFELAIPGFCKVNAVWSHGGGKVGTRPAHEVVDRLSVPKLHLLGLTGLINRDAGELVGSMEERLKTKYRPLLEAQMDRSTYPITKAECDRRLLYCQAIDLAVGRPTDAVRIFQWMSGMSVTRQSMHEMKSKIAVQCKLTTRAWRPPAAKKFD